LYQEEKSGGRPCDGCGVVGAVCAADAWMPPGGPVAPAGESGGFTTVGSYANAFSPGCGARGRTDPGDTDPGGADPGGADPGDTDPGGADPGWGEAGRDDADSAVAS
jgi:hypothetical protein